MKIFCIRISSFFIVEKIQIFTQFIIIIVVNLNQNECKINILLEIRRNAKKKRQKLFVIYIVLLFKKLGSSSIFCRSKMGKQTLQFSVKKIKLK